MMLIRLAKLIALMAVATAMIAVGYLYWHREEARATGPLAEALLAHFDPNEDEQILDDVANDFFGRQTSIADRRAILETEGFDCVIRPANIAGNEILSCQRPIEGRLYCDRFNFYAYQTAEGEVIESLMSTHRMAQQDRILGRCFYSPPRIDG